MEPEDVKFTFHSHKLEKTQIGRFQDADNCRTRALAADNKMSILLREVGGRNQNSGKGLKVLRNDLKLTWTRIALHLHS